MLIKDIIFDLGNVLVDFDHTIAAKRLSAFTDKDAGTIYNLFFDSELTGLFEEGKISPPDFFLKVKEALELKLDYDGFLPIWNEIFFLSQKNIAVYNLANSLKGGYKLTLLSNINVLHFDFIKKTFPVFGAFHNILASCQLGLRKPQSQIYEKTLAILKASGAEVFYADDRPELVRSAAALGLRAFVFTGVEKLRQDLLKSGINVS